MICTKSWCVLALDLQSSPMFLKSDSQCVLQYAPENLFSLGPFYGEIIWHNFRSFGRPVACGLSLSWSWLKSKYSDISKVKEYISNISSNIPVLFVLVMWQWFVSFQPWLWKLKIYLISSFLMVMISTLWGEYTSPEEENRNFHLWSFPIFLRFKLLNLCCLRELWNVPDEIKVLC